MEQPPSAPKVPYAQMPDPERRQQLVRIMPESLAGKFRSKKDLHDFFRLHK